jgi:hypothetical protein
MEHPVHLGDAQTPMLAPSVVSVNPRIYAVAAVAFHSCSSLLVNRHAAKYDGL